MTPKEKAVELIYKYWNTKVETFHVKESIISKELAIKCALIAVEEVIDNIEDDFLENDLKYWQEVKQEIKKL